MTLIKRIAVLIGALAVAASVLVGVGSAVSQAAPSNTSLPSISGSAKDGSLLTASHGGWTGSPTSYAYAWERCDNSGGSCTADHRRYEQAVHAHQHRREQSDPRRRDCDQQFRLRYRYLAGDQHRAGDRVGAEEHVGSLALGHCEGRQASSPSTRAAGAGPTRSRSPTSGSAATPPAVTAPTSPALPARPTPRPRLTLRTSCAPTSPRRTPRARRLRPRPRPASSRPLRPGATRSRSRRCRCRTGS